MKNKNSQFTKLVSIVSHQMQTPITRIKWILAEFDLSQESEEKKESIKEVMDAAEELHYLVKDFANVSKLEKGEMNGLEFLIKLKENPKLAEIPIFVVSNTATDDKVNKMVALGIEKYFVKAENRLEDIINDIKETINN